MPVLAAGSAVLGPQLVDGMALIIPGGPFELPVTDRRVATCSSTPPWPRPRKSGIAEVLGHRKRGVTTSAPGGEGVSRAMHRCIRPPIPESLQIVYPELFSFEMQRNLYQSTGERKEDHDMQEQVANFRTTLSTEETITRAVQFFSTEKWRATSQSPRTATFEGKPPIPWGLMLLTVLGFILCVVPGVILYVTLVQKIHKFFNLVVTANPFEGGTEVIITYPKPANKLVERFLSTLPPISEPEVQDVD
jgi:hypothetical protein